MNPNREGNIRVGDRAPDFTLPDQWGNLVSLKDYLGSNNVVLYFYPKDKTPGCSKEAAAFRDNHNIFKDLGAEIIGISSDSVESHSEFSVSHNLTFKLLSDNGGAVRKMYGVSLTLGLIPGRVTYVIDREGTVRFIISSQLRPRKHVEESLRIANHLAQ